ncbi:MAG: tyrosine-type recombinase/integrase [Candidatus Eisenbacteria bacterium]
MTSKTRAVSDAPVLHMRRDELARLLQAARRRGVRDHLLLALSYRLGLRASEAIGLQAGDVDVLHGEVAVAGLKGGTIRRYALPRDLAPLARRWLKFRGNEPGAFFTGRQGASLTRQRLWQVVKACAAAAGLPTWVRFHTLRHSIGVHMVDAKMPLESVKDLLRHRSIRSTEVYAATSLERRVGYLREMDLNAAIVKVGR